MATTQAISDQEYVSEKAAIEEILSDFFGVTPEDASIDQIYKSVSKHIVDILMDKKKKFKDRKSVV